MPNEPRPPKASSAQVIYHLRRLRQLFRRATDHQFLQLMWAIDALRAGHPEVAARFLNFPREAANQAIGSHYALHQWELETLVIQLLLTPREERKPGAPVFDCSTFTSVANLVNRLRKLEDIEAAVYLAGTKLNVFGELHRIAQRTFHWQRGYFNLPQFYRSAFIYGQGKCGEYFEKTYGLPISELNFVGFTLYAHSARNPWMKRIMKVPELGLTEDLVTRALPLLLISIDDARDKTEKLVGLMNGKHGSPLPTAFLPSILRQFPLIGLKEDADEFIAPISELLLMRVTSGLYYDLVPGGQPLLNDASDRFEEYSTNYLGASMDRFEVRRAYRYEQKKGAPVDTPDMLVTDGGKLVLAVECKATKLNYLAQFAEDPFEAEKKQYLQIASGVFQLWRFFSHVRRGLVKETIDADTAAMVLTLDTFMTMDRGLKDTIIAEAIALADKEGDISADDRRHIIFCSIYSLEVVVSTSTEDIFLASLKAARQEKYIGWEFQEISREEARDKEKIEQKKYPFGLDEVLPWWKRTHDVVEKKNVALPEV